MDQLWAPWRLQYVSKDANQDCGCFFCAAMSEKTDDREALLLYQDATAIVMMNRFPYAVGHLMVAPVRHIGDVEDANQEEIIRIWQLGAACKRIQREKMKAQGCNLGLNQGACAGAGVLDHLHLHVVPRWDGDVNFMPVLADAKVMPQALLECYDRLLPHFQQLNAEDLS